MAIAVNDHADTARDRYTADANNVGIRLETLGPNPDCERVVSYSVITNINIVTAAGDVRASLIANPDVTAA